MATMWLWLYDPNYGLINRILAPIAHWFGTSPPDWVGNDALRWGVPAFVIMGLWTVGGGMLIYLAALEKCAGVPVRSGANRRGQAPSANFSPSQCR